MCYFSLKNPQQYASLWSLYIDNIKRMMKNSESEVTANEIATKSHDFFVETEPFRKNTSNHETLAT